MERIRDPMVKLFWLLLFYGNSWFHSQLESGFEFDELCFSPWLHSCSPNWWLWPWHGLKSPRQKGLPFRSVGLCAKEVMQRPEMVEVDHVSSLSSENWWVLNYLIHFETYAMRITEFMMVNIGIDGQWVCDQYVPAPEMMKWRTTWKRLKIRLKAVITYFIHHVLHSKICGVHWSSNIYIYIFGICI